MMVNIISQVLFYAGAFGVVIAFYVAIWEYHMPDWLRWFLGGIFLIAYGIALSYLKG